MNKSLFPPSELEEAIQKIERQRQLIYEYAIQC